MLYSFSILMTILRNRLSRQTTTRSTGERIKLLNKIIHETFSFTKKKTSFNDQ